MGTKNFLSIAARAIPCTLGLRVNRLRSASSLEDVAALTRSTIGPDVILLSKVEAPDELQLYGGWMTAAGKSSGLWALIETGTTCR